MQPCMCEREVDWLAGVALLLKLLPATKVCSGALRCRSSWPSSWAPWGLPRHRWPSQMWLGLEVPFKACSVSSTANLSSHSYKVCQAPLDGEPSNC